MKSGLKDWCQRGAWGCSTTKKGETFFEGQPFSGSFKKITKPLVGSNLAQPVREKIDRKIYHINNRASDCLVLFHRTGVNVTTYHPTPISSHKNLSSYLGVFSLSHFEFMEILLGVWLPAHYTVFQ